MQYSNNSIQTQKTTYAKCQIGKEREYRLIERDGNLLTYICSDGRVYKKHITDRKAARVPDEVINGHRVYRLNSGYKRIDELVCWAFFRNYHIGTPIIYKDNDPMNCHARNLTFVDVQIAELVKADATV